MMGELLTADEVATMLKISTWQVYDLAKQRSRTGEVRKDPLPTIRLGSLMRFSREDVEAWLTKQQQKKTRTREALARMILT